MEQRKVIEVDGKKLHIVFGKEYKEWYNQYNDYTYDELWSFHIMELLDGTIDINEHIWYWMIWDRCYETTEGVQ